MSKNVLAIANYRVSSDEQKKNGSLSKQERAVREAAKQLNVTIVKTWSGSVSSKKDTNVDRKDLNEMLALCKKNPRIKYVIIDELDRFMRSMLEIGYFLVLFKRAGVKVSFASQPNLKTDTAAQTLILMLEAYKAEGSNEERITKSISGQTEALRAGKYPFVPKPGYRRGTQKAIPEIDSVRGPALRDALVRIASHIVTPTDALIELNQSDYTKSRAKLKMDKFRKIATDPFYAGIVEIRKQVDIRNENGLHEPLITVAQHEELVRIFDGKKKNQKGPRKNGNPKYPLNVIVSHSSCLEHKNKGKFVGLDLHNGKNRSRIYEKYRCRSCNMYLHRDELHKKVTQQLKKVAITPKGVIAVADALEIVWSRNDKQAEQDAVRMGVKINQLKLVIESTVDAAIDPSNIAIKDNLLAKIEKQKAQVEQMERDLSNATSKSDEDRQRFMLYALRFVGDMNESFLELKPDYRTRCKQIVFPAGFYIDANNNVYTPEISPLIRLASNKKDAEASELALMVRVRRL